MKSLQRSRLVSRASHRNNFRTNFCPNCLCCSFSASAANTIVEQVEVGTRSNGAFTLDLYQPSSGTPSRGPVILYLPSISNHLHRHLNLNSSHDEGFIPSQLLATSQATIVKINYRLSPQHTYPTPIHDVAAGLDWVVGNLLSRPESQDVNFGAAPGPGRSALASTSVQPGIGIYGDLIGGGLAAALALTECRASSPARIAAAVVNNPLLDWTSLEKDLSSPSTITSSGGKKRTKRSSHDQDSAAKLEDQARVSELKALILLRKQLFPSQRASTHFDLFASPILFLRTPGVETPSALSGQAPHKSMVPEVLNDDITDEELTFSDTELDEKFSELMGLEAERERELKQRSRADKVADLSESEMEAIEASSQARHGGDGGTTAAFASGDRRVVHRKHPRHYPPSDWGETVIPRFRITSNPSPHLSALGLDVRRGQSGRKQCGSTVLQAQAEEFVRLLRRAVVRSRLGLLPTRRQLERQFCFLSGSASGTGPGIDSKTWSSGYANESWITSEKEKLASHRAEQEIVLRAEIERLIEYIPPPPPQQQQHDSSSSSSRYSPAVTFSNGGRKSEAAAGYYSELGKWFGGALREDGSTATTEANLEAEACY